jgi:lipopolysaccharide cholinephosphotransferase
MFSPVGIAPLISEPRSIESPRRVQPTAVRTSELSKIHELQLLLMSEVRRICEEYHISYFLIAGTLLGAVRHKGFIPWDDDMDVGMFREDYDRFLSACATELDENKFFLQTLHTDKGYGLCFAKLQLKGTRFVERNAADTTAAKGIYIDIFPFDNAPEEDALRGKHDRRTYLLKRLLLAKLGYRTCNGTQPLKRFVYCLLAFYTKFCTQEKLIAKLEKEIKRYNGTRTERVVAIGGSYGYRKETVRREWFAQTVIMPFEGEEFPVPAAYVPYLENLYGDYMTPPPESQRGSRHNVLQIDFGGWRS